MGCGVSRARARAQARLERECQEEYGGQGQAPLTRYVSPASKNLITREGSFKVQEKIDHRAVGRKRKKEKRNNRMEDEESWDGVSWEEKERNAILQREDKAAIERQLSNGEREAVGGSGYIWTEDKTDRDDTIHFSIFRAFDRQEKFRRLDRRKEIEKKRIGWEQTEAQATALAMSSFQFGNDPAPSDTRVCVSDEVLQEVMEEMNIDQESAYKALKRSRNNKTLAIKYICQQATKRSVDI